VEIRMEAKKGPDERDRSGADRSFSNACKPVPKNGLKTLEQNPGNLAQLRAGNSSHVCADGDRVVAGLLATSDCGFRLRRRRQKKVPPSIRSGNVVAANHDRLRVRLWAVC